MAAGRTAGFYRYSENRPIKVRTVVAVRNEYLLS